MRVFATSLFKKGLLLLSIVSLFSCSTSTTLNEGLAEEMYEKGMEDLSKGFYHQGITQLNKLQTLYPNDVLTENAWLQKSYGYLQRGDPALAQLEVQEFMRNYPNHPHIDYAMFMLAFSEHAKTKSFATLYFNDAVQNDILPFKLSLQYYQNLIRRFPESPYTVHAKKEIKQLTQDLARQELLVARQYANNNIWVGSILRAQKIVENYSESTYVEEAWKLIERGYRELKVTSIANDVLKHRQKIINKSL